MKPKAPSKLSDNARNRLSINGSTSGGDKHKDGLGKRRSSQDITSRQAGSSSKRKQERSSHTTASTRSRPCSRLFSGRHPTSVDHLSKIRRRYRGETPLPHLRQRSAGVTPLLRASTPFVRGRREGRRRRKITPEESRVEAHEAGGRSPDWGIAGQMSREQQPSLDSLRHGIIWPEESHDYPLVKSTPGMYQPTNGLSVQHRSSNK